eukprot:9486621-Pyramimonas_sp.AAC.1
MITSQGHPVPPHVFQASAFLKAMSLCTAFQQGNQFSVARRVHDQRLIADGHAGGITRADDVASAERD